MTEALTATARLHFDEDNILHVIYAEGAMMDVADIRNIYSVITRLSAGKKLCLLIDICNSYTITPEARKYAMDNLTPRLATAVLTKSCAVKYLSDLYSTVYRPATPLKFFLDEAKAIAWLNTFKES
jgi:hypothetical protein